MKDIMQQSSTQSVGENFMLYTDKSTFKNMQDGFARS